MYSSKPDFKSYSQDELREALKNIDKTQFPERVKEINSLLIDSSEIDEHSSQKNVEKEWTPKTQFWFCLLGGIFMAFLIFDGIDSGYMRGKRGGANFEQEPNLFYLLLAFYAILLMFCVHGIYESRKRLRKKNHGDIHINQ